MKLSIGLDLGVNKAAIYALDENGEAVLNTIVAPEPTRSLFALKITIQHTRSLRAPCYASVGKQRLRSR
jgi:hypothetical protein